MTSKDATQGNIGGGQVERIPPNAEPEDVIIGKPSDIDDLVVKLRAYAGAFEDGKAQLDVLATKNWTGAGSDSFEHALAKLPKELDSAKAWFEAAANALDAYADKLRSVHKRVKPIIADADAARATSKRHWKEVGEYNEAVDRRDDPLPDRPPDDDPGIAALEDCYRRLDRLETELQGVVDAAKGKLDKAAKKAPDQPPGLKGADAVKKHGQDFLLGMGDSALETFKNAEFFIEDGPGGAGLQLANMADGAAYAVQHPKEFAKAVSNWEEWQRNPARAGGHLTADMLLALAMGPAGAGRRGLTRGMSPGKRLAAREKALRRDGSARKRGDTSDGPHREDGQKTKEGEPVDVATGEMVMAATDVSLPGSLPLVLDRHYVSGHPCGGWFGPTWAATLDQRLELDEAGAVFVGHDGIVLTYPVPEPGVATLPTAGPRWPLLWDGTPESTVTLTIPDKNRALHFAPLPVSGRELALAAITDRTGEGDRIEVSYDNAGAPVAISHSGGYHIAIDTDAALHRITALRLLHGENHERSTRLVSYGYDDSGNLTEVLNSTGLPLRFSYDDEHRITSWTDRNGTSYAYVYDHRGRVLRGIGPQGALSGRFHYDPAGRTTSYTDSQGNTTTYVFNEACQLVEKTDPLGNTTRTVWDEAGRNPVSVTDPLGHTTRYRYDSEENLAAVERPDGTVIEAIHDARGLPVEIRDPAGGTWRHTYDGRGARTSTTDPTGATTHYTYGPGGHLTAVTDPLGNTTTVTTDAAGLPIALTDALGATTLVRRGPHGRITAVTDPLGNTTRQGWTIEGKPAWREHPDGAREEWKWDGEGNLVSHTDEAGNTTRYSPTYFDLVATRTDPDGAHYTFDYDTELRLISVTNPQGKHWRYDYDAAGRLVSETDFTGATRTYTLDAAGRLTARTNALGETLRYSYDAMGRPVTQVDESTGEATAYTYDANGELVHAAGAGTELSLERDPAGRLTKETVNGATTTFGYDAAGNRVRRTTPSGLTSTWTHDATGRPVTLTTAWTGSSDVDSHSLAFTYDAAGRETRRSVGDLGLTRSWDARARLRSETATTVTGDLLQHRSYAYRPDGYVTEIRELTSGTRNFSLDSQGRVTAVQAHGWTEKYAYDTVGNQTHATAPAHPDPGDRHYEGTLLRASGRTSYSYDAAGRLTRRTRKLLNGQTRTWTYTWNAQDQLTRATNPRGEVWTYTYDPLGRRTAKTGPTDADLLTFAWDGTRLAEQSSPNGSTTWDYAPGTHRPLTQTDRELGVTRFHAVLTDLTGTPTELLTPAGEVTWRHRTTLWGTPLPSPPNPTTTSCPLRFPGQYADQETGLNYNFSRYYDPETGRYLSADPLGLSPGPHPYGYVGNPLGRVDVLGREGCPADGKSNRDRPPVEGDTNYIVDNPANPADTITDIDRIENGTLWEEKSATGQNPNMKIDPWVNKHVFKKLDAYVRARSHLPGWENAPIGLSFVEPGATPTFRRAVESAVAAWQQNNPGVEVRIRWAD
ncbi:putative T7SS-secreted protein [Streptomyces cacaoi]|uniref:Type IV secretion protein Rhs n=1 Tax=Streptomyces cacaoi TaxID=1898 RepID=A0A4Y3R571_STRCI|nr:DUF6531 domain-containing protein [Streptomyces cacaoi]NNG86380.1 type IV secretion protein Rhs [Streptomyces cacaoi]GEB52856.1 hypothetical protein SCA03_54070 [Streptomyces cacaoi]